MIRRIFEELKKHAPFTIAGALIGVGAMIFCYKLPSRTAYNLFYIFHPMHVFLSALVTASMYKNYRCVPGKKGCNIVMLLVVGMMGAIGVATVSDSIVPFIGEVLLKMPKAELHIGFIEEWKRVTLLAIIGIGTAYFWPQTKFPHAGHVLISTWASLFHVVMAGTKTLTLGASIGIFAFLFIAVWIPCCVSDIVFPLLFVGDDKKEQT